MSQQQWWYLDGMKGMQSSPKADAHRALKGSIASKAQISCNGVEGTVHNATVVPKCKSPKAGNSHSPDDR